jgi:hypothetical protein
VIAALPPYFSPAIAIVCESDAVWLPQITLFPQITLNPEEVLLPHTTELPQITD